MVREALVAQPGGVERLDDRRPAAARRSRRAARSGQDLRPERPHLVDLGRELDEVARHAGAGEARVGDRREQPVQRVAELVEQRVTSSKVSSVGWPSGGSGDVEVVDDDGRGAEQPRLRDEGVHPGAAALALAGVEVAEVQPERRPVGVGHLPDPHVGVVAGQVGALGEPEAVEQLGGVEDAVDQHPVQLELGPQGRGVDGVALGAHLLAVEGPVPRRQLDAVPRGGLARAPPPRPRRWPPTPAPSRRASRRRPRWCGRSASASTRSAWVSKPSSRARSARSVAMRSATGPLSCSPEDARSTDASCTRRRRSRLRSLVSTGWRVGSSSGSSQPSSPRSAAAVRAAATSSAPSPSSSATSSTCTAAASMASWTFCPNVVVSPESSWLSSVSRARPRVVELGAGQQEVQVVALDQPHRLLVQAQVVRAGRARRRCARRGPGPAAGRRSGRPPAARSPARSRAAAAWTPRRSGCRRRSTPAPAAGPSARGRRRCSSKPGGSSEPTIVATSARCSAIPASSASRQCSGVMSPNGGSPNGSGEGTNSGLAGVTGELSAALIAAHPAPWRRPPWSGPLRRSVEAGGSSLPFPPRSSYIPWGDGHRRRRSRTDHPFPCCHDPRRAARRAAPCPAPSRPRSAPTCSPASAAASPASPASSASTTPSCPRSSGPCSPATTSCCSASAARARPA